jgi:hypothetical protein
MVPRFSEVRYRMDESRGRAVEVHKKLTANDIGLTGSHQAAIHIPKHVVRLGFFPLLEEESYNPSCEIVARLMPGGRGLTLRYIHYNGKLTRGGTRDEYRFTGTPEIFRTLDALPGDRLKFSYRPSGEMEISVHREDDDDGDFGVGVSPSAGRGDRSSSGSASGYSREVSSKNGWTVIQVVLRPHTEGE